jgi:hypothetical protein
MDVECSLWGMEGPLSDETARKPTKKASFLSNKMRKNMKIHILGVTK